MTAIALNATDLPQGLSDRWLAGVRKEPRFAAMAMVLVVAMLPTLFAMAIDPRQFNGINVWDKPFKFEVALSVYLATLVLFANWLPDTFLNTRRYKLFSWAVVGAIALEMVWVAGAAANRTGSHFNVEGVMGIIYGLMGLLAVLLTSASFVYGIVFWRDSTVKIDPAVRLSLALGLIVTFVLTVIVAGYMSSASGHWVGGNRLDAEGFPLMGWARDGGDLRVAHFFATHGLHFIPAAGLLASRLLPAHAATKAVWVSAMAFCVFVAFTLFEALLGLPFAGWIV